MLPVMEAEAAADWIAMARPGMMEVGMLAVTSCAAAEERATGEVLEGWVSWREEGMACDGKEELQCGTIEGELGLARKEVGICISEESEREKE